MNPAVHSLDHFALSVPEPESGGEFYSNFGLRTSSVQNALALETGSGVAGYLYDGPAKHLHHLTFGIEASERDAFRTRLEAAGVKLLDPPREAQTDGTTSDRTSSITYAIRGAASPSIFAISITFPKAAHGKVATSRPSTRSSCGARNHPNTFSKTSRR